MFKILVICISLLFFSQGFSQSDEAPPEDWHHLDFEKDSVHGVSVRAAYELVKDRNPSTVIVAVIDSGVDIDHEDLQGSLWINKNEVVGNGIDDDENGYIDDVNGWNFLGAKDGTNIEYDTYEITRQYAVLKAKYEFTPYAEEGNEDEFDRWKEIERKFKNRSGKALKEFVFYRDVRDNTAETMNILKEHLEVDTLTLEGIRSIESADKTVLKAQTSLLNISRMLGGENDFESLIIELDGAVHHFEVQVKYGYNIDYNPREIIGDDYENDFEVGYGNNDVEGPFAEHGTHVSGIIAANRFNDIGIDGIASKVQIMPVRTIPNGDERDKDVAAAIRYAVDNGAQIINMSFGKSFDDRRQVVDSAVDYAVSRNVLMVFGAGNSNKDLDVEETFPTPMRGDSRVPQWISVGAVGWQIGENYVADFSNYGQSSVDLFAPGERVTSTTPDNTYMPLDGTSMAAPVVSGIAAMLLSYFPDFSALEVQNIILNSVTKYEGLDVNKPGRKEILPFSSLSISQGVINAKAAILLALDRD